MAQVRITVIELVLLVAYCLSLFNLSTTAHEADTCDFPLLNGSIFHVLNWYYHASGSVNATHSPDQVLFDANGWCANEQGFNIYGPRLHVMFGTEVKITSIEIGAVNNDTLIERIELLGHNDNEVLNCPCNRGGIVQDTDLSENDTVSSIAVGSTPVIGRNITVLPVQWKSHIPCLYLELYGCLYTPVCNSIQQISALIENSGTQLILWFQSPVVVTSLTFPEGLQNVTFTNNSNFNVYRDFTGRREFNISNTFTFWSPELFVNHMLTITIGNQGNTTGVSNVTVYGCNQDDIITRMPEPSTSSLSPSSTVIMVTKRDYLIVEAGVPLASLTVGIVGILVLCGIVHAYHIKRQAERKLKKLAYKDSVMNLEESKETTLKKVDNELYSNGGDGMTIRNAIPYTAYIDGEFGPSRHETSTDKSSSKDVSKTYESIHN